MKIIEQAGFAQRRSLLTFEGSDRNAAAWVAMNASRGFPPYSPCQCVSASKPVPASRNRVLAGAACVKKLRSDTGPLRDRTVGHQCLDHVAQRRAQPAQGLDVRQAPARHARSLDPPPGRRAALRRQEVIRHGRSGDRDRINEIHGDNKFADNGEPAATGRAGYHAGTIGIRNFDKCHEFFETLTSCRRRK